MDLAFVTSNPGKLREATDVLAPFGIRVVPRRRVLPEPQADSLEEVVRAKLAALGIDRRAQLVEDSGLFLDGLGGFPGVYSAHVYRLWGGKERFAPIFDLLAKRSRAARFRTVAGLRVGGKDRLFTGEVAGTIARRPRGSNGFGFDPIFVPTGSRRTFGEMLPGEKLAISHRGRAMAAVGRHLATRPDPRRDGRSNRR